MLEAAQVERKRQSPAIQSLDRGLVIVEFVSKSSQPVSIAELSELLKVDRSSAFRLANTLKRRGFLACPSGRKDYILGPSLWRLLHHYDWGKMLVRIAHSHLKLLAAQTGETAHLAVREGEKALFIDSVVGNHVIAVSGQAGESVPLYCTAHGKALLAEFSARQLASLFGAGPLKGYTARTTLSVAALAEDCLRVKSQGFAQDDGEHEEGLRCVAAPVRERGGGDHRFNRNLRAGYPVSRSAVRDLWQTGVGCDSRDSRNPQRPGARSRGGGAGHDPPGWRQDHQHRL